MIAHVGPFDQLVLLVLLVLPAVLCVLEDLGLAGRDAGARARAAAAPEAGD